MNSWPVWWTRTTRSPRLLRLHDRLRELAASPLGYVLALGAGLALIAASVYLRFKPQSGAPCDADFYAFYHSALALRHGVAPYGPLAAWIGVHGGALSSDPFSNTACLSGVLEFSYTPFFGLLFIPFTALPYSAALLVWDGCQLLFLCGAVYAFLRAARLRPRLPHLLLLAGAIMLTGPFRFELYYAQADLFLLCCICLGLWACCSGRRVLAGLLLAGACASEPALLAAVPLLLWKREWRFAATTLLASAALILAPFLWLGGAALGNLLVIWRYYVTVHAAADPFNNSPLGVLFHLFTVNPLVRPLVAAPGLVWPLWLLLAAIVVALAAALIERRPVASDSRPLLDLGLAACAFLLISPYAENNHFTLLLLPFLAVYVCLRRGDWREPAWGALAACFAGALLLAYAFSDPLQRLVLAHLASGTILRVATVLLAATYLYPLFAIAAVVIYAQRRVSPLAGAHAAAHGAAVQHLAYPLPSDLPSPRTGRGSG